MELKTIGQTMRLVGREGFIEGSRRVGVEVIERHDDDFGVWIVDIRQVAIDILK